MNLKLDKMWNAIATYFGWTPYTVVHKHDTECNQKQKSFHLIKRGGVSKVW